MSKDSSKNFPHPADMQSSLCDRITAVQAQHHHWDHAGSLACACGEGFGLAVDAGWEAAVQGWAAHVADAVIADLSLKITVDYMSADQQRRNWMLAGHCTMSFTDDTTGDINHD